MTKKQTQAQAQAQQAVAEPKGWKLFTNGRGVRTGEVKASGKRKACSTVYRCESECYCATVI